MFSKNRYTETMGDFPSSLSIEGSRPTGFPRGDILMLPARYRLLGAGSHVKMSTSENPKYGSMSLKELKAELKKRKAKQSGRKHELVTR